MAGSVHGWGPVWWGGMHGRGARVAGGHAWWGACMAVRACMAGGMHGGGHAWQGACVPVGVCMVGGMHGREGMCTRGWHVCQVACVAGEMATAVDGMHPTGMHSC